MQQNQGIQHTKRHIPNLILRVFLVLKYSFVFLCCKIDRNKFHVNGNINEKDVIFLL